MRADCLVAIASPAPITHDSNRWQLGKADDQPWARETAYETKRAVVKKTFRHGSIFERGYLASTGA